MTFRQWYIWFKNLELSRKWFIVFILLRPIVDNFYELKTTSALASPLYIMGVLTPVLILMSMLSSHFPRTRSVLEDAPISLWAVFVFFNCSIFWFINMSVTSLGDLIKYTTPILMYFYSRRFIQSREDLHGVLTTFLIAVIYPFGMLMYESFINPIGIDYLSTGRGGGSRIRGAYADIMNYAIYLILFLITAGYFYLRNIYNDRRMQVKIQGWHLIAVIVFVVYGFTRIKHVSTWTVGLFIILLLMFHNLRNIRGAMLVAAFSLIILPFFAQDIYDAQIAPLINKEILVAKGERKSEQALNGRVTRWEKYIEVWEQMPDINHFIGVSTTNVPEVEDMIGAGMHSDYIRNLFVAGILGLLSYLLFIFMMASKWAELMMPEKFLLISTLSALVLWSVSTIPTLYAPLLYYMFPVFSYALLPQNRRYTN